jgi:hypothetical protein
MTGIFEHQQSFDKLVFQATIEIAEFLRECEEQEKRLDEVEEGLFRQLMKMGRRLLQSYGDSAGNGDQGPTCQSEGGA